MRLFVIIVILFLANCLHLQVIKTSEDSLNIDTNSVSVKPEEVIILRCTKPEDMSKYREIGVVVLRGEGLKIEDIFQQLRNKASEYGAHYVVDISIKTNQETRTVTSSSGDNGPIHSVVAINHTYYVVAYTVTGTLLRRIQ